MKQLLLPLAVFLVAGCNEGSAPVIENLEVGRETLVFGEPNTVTFAVDFTDPDGDVAQAQVELVSQDDGLTVVSGSTPIQGAEGLDMGRFSGEVSITPQATGYFYLRVSIIDEANNQSNALSESVEVVEPAE